MRYFALVTLSFFCFNYSHSMNHNGSDIESSTSDAGDGYFVPMQDGNYYIILNLVFKNNGKKDTYASAKIKINNKSRIKKTIKIEPYKTENLHISAIIYLKNIDSIQYTFDTGKDVEVVSETITEILIPKNSWIKG